MITISGNNMELSRLKAETDLGVKVNPHCSYRVPGDSACGVCTEATR